MYSNKSMTFLLENIVAWWWNNVQYCSLHKLFECFSGKTYFQIQWAVMRSVKPDYLLI